MINAVNLTKTYYQGRARIGAVKNVTLEIRRRDSVLITGPSGAGKSTLLHLLGGLDIPTSGKLMVDGADFYEKPDRARSAIRNEKMGFVFQLYHLLPEFSVLENVMLPALIKRSKDGQGKKDIKKNAERLLDIVGLYSRMKHRPGEISGGESQRTAIARALINSPEILFCDEPTGNLDSKTASTVIESLWALKNVEKMAFVIVTHAGNIREGFDKVFTIADGILGEAQTLTVNTGREYGQKSLR